MKTDFKHIAVSGNIGVGKTTLTEKLAKHFNWQAQYENVSNNPYLNDFYNDMQRWAFHIQIFFLNNRLQNLLEIRRGNQTFIQDRTIYEDAYIFALNLYNMGLMSQRDYANYKSVFSTIEQLITPPDLIIHLEASTEKLEHQILKRGRSFERNIRKDYLEKLNLHYNEWILNYKAGPKLIINCENLNFDENEADFQIVLEKIKNVLEKKEN